MDDTQAQQIISALADGCDPTTGEEIEGSVLQRSDVIRALYIAVRAFEASACFNARSGRVRIPANAGKPWTEQEDRELLEKFDAGQSVVQLAQGHDRTLAGIQARLQRHGRLECSEFAAEEGRRYRGRRRDW